MIKEMQQQINKGLGQIRQAFMGIVSRSGTSSVQLQGYENEVLEDVEVMQQVGFSSHIPVDVKVALIPQQGKTSMAIIVATKGGKISIEVGEGETCIYDQFGHSVWLKEDGTHVEGDLFVNGKVHAVRDVIDKKGSMQEMREIYNTHNNGPNTSTPSVSM